MQLVISVFLTVSYLSQGWIQEFLLAGDGDGEGVLLLQTVKANNFHYFHAVKGLFLFVNQLLRDTREVHVIFYSLRTLSDETILSRFRQYGRALRLREHV